jgi:DNA polymerase III delta prime subunit
MKGVYNSTFKKYGAVMANKNGVKTKEQPVRLSPFYATEYEKDQLIKMRDNFAFDDVEKLPQVVVLLAGPPGVGKTHTACTMTKGGPVYILDTEQRAAIVARKFKQAGREVYLKVCRTYQDLVVSVKAINRLNKPGTIIFDSGTDLSVFTEIAYLERTRLEKVFPLFNWGEVYAMSNALIDEAKLGGHKIVITARVKERYVNDKPSGEIVPKVYDPVLYKADVSILWKDRTAQPELYKNGQAKDLSIPVPENIDLPDFINQLINLSIKTKKG